MSEPSNNERADWAMAGVKAFAKITGVGDEDLHTQVSDFLADLMHLADLEQLEWDSLLARADNHYQEEVRLYGRASKSPKAWSPRTRKRR